MKKVKVIKADKKVNASKGFNLVNEDGSERRFEAYQPFSLSEISESEMKELKASGVEFYDFKEM